MSSETLDVESTNDESFIDENEDLLEEDLIDPEPEMEPEPEPAKVKEKKVAKSKTPKPAKAPKSEKPAKAPKVEKPVKAEKTIKPEKTDRELREADLSEEDHEHSVMVSRGFKVLGDATRVSLLKMLDRDEIHVGALADKLDYTQPAVSHHLALLRHGGYVDQKRDGKHMFYRLTEAGQALVDIVKNM